MKYLNKIPFLLILLLFGCSVGYELSQQNLSGTYDPQLRFTQPEFLIAHTNDSITNVYLHVNLSEFLYTRENENGKYIARIEISYSLYESYESKIILDSAALFYTDSIEYGLNSTLSEVLFVKAKAPGDYILKVSILDIHRGKELSYYLPIYKKSMIGSQSFMLFDKDSSLLFRNYISPNENVSLKYLNISQEKLFVHYYKRDFPLARPPFVLDKEQAFNYKADSTFSIPVFNGNSHQFNLVKEGFYFFQSDTNSREGFTIYRYYDDFPVISSAEHVISPLRYISTQREYDILTSSSNKKLTADSFWLVNTGHPNRARQLISRYYNRVQEANNMFSSFLEGWKTDRGMVYIVLGPPNYVYRATNTENWVYGEAGNPGSLRFSFIRVNNPFTNNDYNLYRNPMFKETWYNSVENWRR